MPHTQRHLSAPSTAQGAQAANTHWAGRSGRLVWTGAALLGLCTAAGAQTVPEATNAAAANALRLSADLAAPPAKPLWELGMVGVAVSQQAYPGSDQQVHRAIALPFFVYRGRWLRADGETVGVRALKTPTTEIDIGFSGAFGSSSTDVVARAGMPSLGTLAEFGPRLKWNLGQDATGNRWLVKVPLRGVFDLSHQFTNRGLAFEPEVEVQNRTAGGWAWNASLGAVVGNRTLNQHFYGVDAAYATPTRPAYSADAGLVAWRLKVAAQRSLGHGLSVFGYARLDSVAGAANRASPLMRQSTGPTVALGLSYTAFKSERPAQD